MIWGIKGNLVFTKDASKLTIFENGIILYDENKIVDVCSTLPIEYKEARIKDYGNRIIIPGLIDLHVHAPQYAFRGTGMDLELLEWLNTFTFVEETKFKDTGYADKVYTKFVNDLKKSATTRASIFSTIHVEATIKLMNLLEESGLVTYVGKVNMNRNCPSTLLEGSGKKAKDETLRWLHLIEGKFSNTFPIITPRFIPSCDDELLDYLGRISKEYNLPNQSHLSENLGEIEWVKELKPEVKFYGEGYHSHNLFGGKNQTIMAHCVHSCEEEIELMKRQGVYVAHCPTSNVNLSSGIAPAKRYLEENINIGLGSDIAAGHNLSMFKVMADAIGVSKLRWRLQDSNLKPLNVSESLYMATKGGGSFFGRVGSFEKGYEMDAIVLDDKELNYFGVTDIANRLERIVYQDHEAKIIAKYVKGKQIF